MKIKIRYKDNKIIIPFGQLLKSYERDAVSHLKDLGRVFGIYAGVSNPSGAKSSGGTEILYANGHDISNYLAGYGIGDCQIQAVMRLDGRLDPDRLKRAVRLSVDEEPVFGCRFVEGEPPYWRRRDNIDEIGFFSMEETENPDEAIRSFQEAPLDMGKDPMVKVKLIRSKDCDVLGVKISHACCDGAGTKEYLQLLADIYSRTGTEGEAFKPNPRIAGRKDQDRMFEALGIRKPELGWNPVLEMPKTVWPFPWKQGGTASVRYVISRLPAGSLDTIIRYGKERGATVNDLILTAFYRAMFEISKPVHGIPMDIACTVDLRRYLPDGKAEAIRNFSGGFDTKISRAKGESFEGTLYRVMHATKKAKDRYPGLKNAMGGEFIEKMSFLQLLALIKTSVQTSQAAGCLYPFTGSICSPGLSNLGYISKNLIKFGDASVVDAYILPPVLRAPGFLNVAGTYNGVMTMAIGYYKGSVKRSDMQKLLDRIMDELIKGCVEV